MNRKLFSIIGLIILSLLLFWAGMWVGQAQAFNTSGQYGYGMMGNMNGQNTSGMMNGQVGSMMGSSNMMGLMSGFSGLSDVDPLTMDEADTAVTSYLTTLNQDNLKLGEIMIFANHAYAQVIDSDTGQGAFELLIDPATGNVFPEPGPNMMWNTQYGMMSGFGNGMMGSNMMGNGMMNGSTMGSYGYAPDAEINTTATEAVNIAQEVLDANLPGKTADETADSFPGYYTLHILEDGQTIGMMSVNAYTGQAFLHHWHGDFIEMSESQHK